MREAGAEGRIKRTALTRDARRQLDQLIAARLLAAGHEPYKPNTTSKANNQRSEHGPDLRARWVFPTIGLSRAARVAHQVTIAAQGRDLSHLRLVTLRSGATKPKPNELSSHLDTLSQDINIHVPYMKAMRWIAPVLSVPQIRLDHDGRLDPHLHALWDIAPDTLSQVRAYLEERYAGGAWIDDKPVRSLRKAAFYIASGMLDYPAVPEWPDDVVDAIWKLGPRRMIRPAGWYATHLKGRDGSQQPEANSDPSGRRAPQRLQDTPGTGRSKHGGSRRSKHETTLRRAISGAQGANKSLHDVATTTAGGEPQHSEAQEGWPNTSTVRLTTQESRRYNPFNAPTIDEFWIALRLLEVRNREPEESLTEFCDRLSLSELHVRVAVARVESYLETHVFYPGESWAPTPSGIAFLDRGLPHLQALDLLTVELGADAAWMRHPERLAFEARIGITGPRAAASTPIKADPED